MKIIYKSTCSIIAILFLCNSLVGQDKPILLNLSVAPPYAIELEAYLEYDFNVIMGVTNTAQTQKTIFFSAALEADYGFNAVTNDNSMKEYIVLEPGENRTFTGDQLGELYAGFTEADINTSGISSEQLDLIYTNRILPEGEYTLCLVARDSLTGDPLSEGTPLGCASFEIVFPDRPIITHPTNDLVIPENPTNLIPFSWSPPGSITPELLMRTNYDLKVIDITIYDNLSPTEAMLDPAVDFIYFEEDIQTLTHIPDVSLDLIAGHRYAVRVTAKDSEGSINYQNDGHSEVETFVYGDEDDAEYINLSPPMLTTPSEGTIIPEGLIIEYGWTPPAWDDNGVNPMTRYSVGIIENNSLTPYVNEYNVNTINFVYLNTPWEKALDHSNTLELSHAAPPFLTLGKSYHACIFVDTENDPMTTIPPFENNGWGNCITFNYGDPEESYSAPIITQPIAGTTVPSSPPNIINPTTIEWLPSDLTQDFDMPLNYLFGIKEYDYTLPDVNYENMNSLGLEWIETGYKYKNLHTYKLDIVPDNYVLIDGKSYIICPLVKESLDPTGEQPHMFDNYGLGECVVINYGEPEAMVEAPKLIKPSEGTKVNEDEIMSYEWVASDFETHNLNPNIQYKIGVIEKTDELPSVPLHLRDGLDFHWEWTGYKRSEEIANTMEGTNYFKEGIEYFACIKVEVDDPAFPVTLEQGGWGNCVTIEVKKKNDTDTDDEETETDGQGDDGITSDCIAEVNFEFDAYYPLAGDTLPFIYFPIVAQFDPVCDEVRQIGFDLQYQSSDDNKFTAYIRTGAKNNWPNGPMPFLQNIGITDPTPLRTSLLPLNMQSEQDDNQVDITGTTQGKNYSYVVPSPTATMITSFSNEKQTSGFSEVNFNIGMPMPKMVYPAQNDTLLPGTVNLQWNTGNAPERVLPPVALVHANHKRIVEGTYLSTVDERYIIQVSKEENFTDETIIYGSQGTVFYDKHYTELRDLPNNQTYTYDIEDLKEAVYKDVSVTTSEITEPGDYFWRVLWLNTFNVSDAVSEIPTPGTKHILGNLIEEDVYRKSSIRRFIIDPDVKQTDTIGGENTKTNCFTENEVPAFDMSPVSSIGDITSFMAGYFAILDLEIENNSGGKISGKGVVQIGFLNNTKVAVSFKDVKLNALNRMVSGEVTADEDSPFSLADINSNIDADLPMPGESGTVNNWLADNADGGRIVSDMAAGRPLGMPIGFKSKIQDNELLIGITEMNFGAKSASLKILYEHHFDKMRDNQYLSLAANIGFKPSGFQNEVLIHLNKDLLLENYWAEENERNIKYTIRRASGTPENIMANGTYLNLECSCVKSLGIAIEAEFDTDKIVKDTDDGIQGSEPVTAKFSFKLNREAACNPEDAPSLPEGAEDYTMRKTNFMVSFTMDDFQFVGLEGWGFKVTEGFLDYSSLSNPTGIEFPKGYDHSAIEVPDSFTPEEASAINNTWTGFYMKEVAIRAPKDFYKINNERHFQAGIKNIFIDETGFSGNINVQNIISTSEGETDGWAFSLDNFELNIVQNTFESGRLDGKLGIPITDEQTPYEAVLAYSVPDDSPANTKPAWGFFMSIKPNGNLNIPPLLGTASLNDNSYVHYKYGKIDKDLIGDDDYDENIDGISLFFDGSIDISTTGSEALSTVATIVDFKGLKFDLSYSNKNGFDWDHTFASPQKFIGGTATEEEGKAGGFPISIRNLSIENFKNEGKCIGAELTYTIGLNLMDDDDGGLQAGADMGIEFSWDTDKRQFQFDSLSLSCIRIGFETKSDGDEAEGTESHGITLKGEVCVYKDKNRCGQLSSGFSGNIHVGLPIAEVKLAADFGSTETYRYWYVDGMVRSNSTPLATMGALALIGISGGFYYNMAIDNGGTEEASGYNPRMVEMASKVNTPDESGAESGAGSGEVEPSGFTVCPQEGSFIFKAGLSLATAADASVFNADVGMELAVTSGQGVTRFRIIGTGYFMTKVSERNDRPPVKADVIISYDKQGDSKVFHAGFAVYVDLEVGPLAVFGSNEDHVQASSFGGVSGKKFVECNFHLTTSPAGNDWYFKLGGPGGEEGVQGYDPKVPGPGALKATLGVGNADDDPGDKDDDDWLTLQIRTYFQIGSNIDEGFMSMPPLITRLLGEGRSEGDSENGLAGGDRFEGENDRAWEPIEGNKEGFILGLSAELNIDIDMFLIYAKFGLAVGFDLNMLNYGKESVCYTGEGELISPIGTNGWYATGRIYAGVEGEVGLQIKFIKKRRIHLFKLGAAFMVQGGFPNPVWAEGRAAIHYSVLGGLFSGSSNFSFSVGEKCKPQKTDPFGFALINEIMPANGAGNGETKVSPFKNTQVSFNIPIHEVLEIPLVGDPDEDGNVEISVELLYPYGTVDLYKSDGSNGGNFVTLHPEDGKTWSEDKTIITLVPKQPIVEDKVSIKVELHAKEIINGVENDVYWPAASGKSGLWKEDSLSTYWTSKLPPKIPLNRIKDTNPIVNQKYYLQQGAPDRTEGYLDFFSYEGDSYLYTSDDKGTYKYVARYYPLDGSSPIESKIINHGNRISYPMPAGLLNDMIYNIKIIRVKDQELIMAGIGIDAPTVNSGNTIAGGQNQLGNNPGSNVIGNTNHLDNLNPNQGPLNPLNLKLSDFEFSDSDIRFVGLHNRMNFVSGARKLQPGSEVAEHEFVIFEYSFKTSKFNSLRDKLAGSSSELITKTITSGDVSWEEPWIYMTLEEHFDIFDAYGYSKVSSENKSHNNDPTVAFMPNYKSDYWKNKASNAYGSILDFNRKIRNKTIRTYYDENAEGNVISNLTTGMVQLRIGNYTRTRYLAKLMENSELSMLFSNLDVTQPLGLRFKNIDPRYVSTPLTEEDIQYAWDTTVESMADETYGTLEYLNGSEEEPVVNNNENNNNMLGNNIFVSGNTTANLFNYTTSLMGGLGDFDISPKFSFKYNLHKGVVHDIHKFRSQTLAMYYSETTINFLGSSIYLGHVQRAHLQNVLGNDYSAFVFFWAFTNKDNYSLRNNSGIYGFDVNHLRHDGETWTNPWSGSNVSLQFNH